ncbi:MAG: MarR family transcriptional regulator [Acidobacteria bacterium]|nr:MAG: MarR family transcriptional regulator [Acidobacteriota bacterium]REK07391.1 MAG: MarR family transcriptional regulator [Acidobacteriota bacterium]
MSSRPVLQPLERLCSLLRADVRQRGLAHGLQPVQVEALCYLASCNRYSDTPQAVTEYLGSTKGTVSQTLKVLEREGLVLKSPDREDRRVVRLRLTARGRALAGELSTPPLFVQALGDSQVDAELLDGELRALLVAAQRATGNRSFGVCHSCRFFRREGKRIFRCGLTEEPLSVADSERICREHDAATQAG